MKKTFFAIAVVASMFVGYTTFEKQNNNKLSDIALANVEALAEMLEEVVITCGLEEGACWIKGATMCFEGEYTFFDCDFTGFTWVSCYHECK